MHIEETETEHNTTDITGTKDELPKKEKETVLI